jgi:hypothetical protein
VADEIKKLKDMVERRKGKMSNRLEPYVSSALHMGHAASTRTAGMIEIESQIAKLEKQREINRETISQFMTQFAKSPSTPEEVNKAFQRHNREAERLQASYELWQSKYQVEKEKREQVARNRFETQVATSAESGMSFTSLDPVEKARALKMAESGVMSGSFSESSIYKGISRLGAQSIRRKEALIEEAKNPTGSIEAFIEKAENLESTKSKLTTLQGAQQVLKSQGLDTESVYKTSKGRLNEILEKRQDLALQSKIQSKEVGSFSQESNKLKDLEEKFVEAQQKFVDALDGPTEELEEFKKSVINAGKSLDDQKKLVDEMKKQGIGDRFGNALDVLRTISRAGVVGADLYTSATVSSENQQMSQRAQFARAQNQMFMDHYAATQGDMTALATIQSQAAGRATLQGVEQGEQQNIGNKIGLAGEAGRLAANIASDVSDLKIVTAIKTAISGATAVGQRTIDDVRGLSVNQAALEGFNARYDLSRATNEVKGAAMQEFYNQSMTNFAATQGFGSRRSDTFKQLQASRLDMARLGVSTEEQAAMYQTALAGMGSEFTKLGTKGAQELATRAAKVGISGVTSAQDYLARVGQISQVGGSDRQVEDILANAVARGVDDAKSFGDMVESLSQLSGQSAGKGIDVTSTMTRSLLGGMDFTRGNGLNERLNLNAVQSQLKTINDMTADSGFTFASMMEQSRLSQIPDISMAGRVNAAKVSGTEAKSIQEAIQSGDITKAKSMADRLGIGEVYFDENGKIRSNALTRSQQFVEAKSSKIEAELMGIADAETSKRIAKGQGKTPAEAALAVASGLGQEGLKAYNSEQFSKGKIADLKGEAAAAQETKAAAQIGKARMSGAGEQLGGGLGAIAADLKSIAESLRPVEAAAKANAAAGAMKLDTGSFDKSVKDFDTAVQMLITALGEKGGPKSQNFSPIGSSSSISVQKPTDNRDMTKTSRIMPGR